MIKDPKEPSSEATTIEMSPTREKLAEKIARITLQACQLTDDFSNIERIPRLADGRRENDVQHSFSLALAAPEIALLLNEEEGLNLDVSRIREFALVHDLLELKVGDVATFDLTPAQLAEKERRECVAKEELLDELPENIAQALEEYEKQDTPEAVFVRMVDKLLPVAVDTTGDGVRIMHEDYGVHTPEQLKASHAELHAKIAQKFPDFPILLEVHKELLRRFEEKFQHEHDANRSVNKERPREHVEIERKFIIERIPDEIDLARMPSEHLRQGYVAVGADGSETRVRSFGNERFELTIKSPGTIARGEQTMKISRDMFEGLWKQTVGQRVEKRRYYIPHGDVTIELDIYEDDLDGLMTAEVEFAGRETEGMVRQATFTPPEWFGDDISEDTRYKNQNLATQGRPHAPLELGEKQL